MATRTMTTLALLAATVAPAAAQSAGYVSISPIETHAVQITTYDGGCHACGATVPFAGYRTYGQGEWGRRVGPAAALRDRHFGRAFPYGLTVGDARLPHGPTFGLAFTSPYAVECFVPHHGHESSLFVSAVDPLPGPGTGGSFTSRLVATKLNVEFDRIGVLGLAPHVTLGELVLVGGVDHRLRGLAVDHLVDVADRTVAGAFGPVEGHWDLHRRCVDVDGDGHPDVTPDDVFDALATVNRNFADGHIDRGNLATPYCDACRRPPVVVAPPSKPVVVGTCHVHGAYGHGSPCAHGVCGPPPGKVVLHAGKGHQGHGNVSFGWQHATSSKTKAHVVGSERGHPRIHVKRSKSVQPPKKNGDPHGAAKKRARKQAVHPRRVYHRLDG